MTPAVFSLASIVFTIGALLGLSRWYASRGPVDDPRPAWLPQLAFVTLAAFLVFVPTVPAALRQLLEDPDATPNPAVGVAATALANLLVIGLAIVFARRRFAGRADELALGRPSGLSLLFGAAAMLLALPAFYGASFLNAQLIEAIGLDQHQALVRSLIDDEEFFSRPWVILSIVLVVPCCEEILFRGVVQRALRVAASPAVAILGSSFLFAAVHDPQSMLPVFVIGIVLGLIVERTGSIWPATVGHALFNALNLLRIAEID